MLYARCNDNFDRYTFVTVTITYDMRTGYVRHMSLSYGICTHVVVYDVPKLPPLCARHPRRGAPRVGLDIEGAGGNVLA